MVIKCLKALKSTNEKHQKSNLSQHIKIETKLLKLATFFVLTMEFRWAVYIV